MAQNKAILREAAKRGHQRPERGIQELLDGGYLVQG
jgi:hypothetical protein